LEIFYPCTKKSRPETLLTETPFRQGFLWNRFLKPLLLLHFMKLLAENPYPAGIRRL